jgi:CheY-like chemotaxis protein
MQEGRSSSPLVMIAEDSEDHRALMKIWLESIGYSVVEASAGPQAIEVILDSCPDLIFMDIGLPEINGLEVIKRVRQESAHSSTPVIITSAYDNMYMREEAYNLGCTSYLTKPIDLDELQSLLQLFLQDND